MINHCPDVRRIEFYVKQVAALGAIHWTRKTDRHRRREERLLRYKAELGRRLNASLKG